MLELTLGSTSAGRRTVLGVLGPAMRPAAGLARVFVMVFALLAPMLSQWFTDEALFSGDRNAQGAGVRPESVPVSRA